MTHEERVWHHEMETLEGIHEHAERIAALEELALDMRRDLAMVIALPSYADGHMDRLCSYDDRMAALGIEAGE